MHSFKTRKVKEGFVAMKVDLQKAYDRVHWDFLEVVLELFGFQSHLSIGYSNAFLPFLPQSL
jgi:hypothetical protein